jgi:hypothetical protein
MLSFPSDIGKPPVAGIHSRPRCVADCAALVIPQRQRRSAGPRIKAAQSDSLVCFCKNWAIFLPSGILIFAAFVGVSRILGEFAVLGRFRAILAGLEHAEPFF